MKELEVPVLRELKENRSVKYVVAFMDNLPKHAINHAPWPQYPYCPQVSFSIGHDNECIY